MTDCESLLASARGIFEAAAYGDAVALSKAPVALLTTVRDTSKRRSLHLAAGSGSAEAVSFLLYVGSDPLARDIHGRTALHDSAEAGAPDVCSLLVEAGADTEARDVGGFRPSDLASAVESAFDLASDTDALLDSARAADLVLREKIILESAAFDRFVEERLKKRRPLIEADNAKKREAERAAAEETRRNRRGR
jgi:hypothetical protein